MSTYVGIALPNFSANLDDVCFFTRFFAGPRGGGRDRVSGQSAPDAPQTQERGGLSPRRHLRIEELQAVPMAYPLALPHSHVIDAQVKSQTWP